MNRAEQKSKQLAEQSGWRVLTVGKPDKILFRLVDGKIQVCFREDKGLGDRLSKDQIVYLTLLTKLGLNAEVWYEWGQGGFTKQWSVGPEEEALLTEYLGG